MLFEQHSRTRIRERDKLRGKNLSPTEVPQTSTTFYPMAACACVSLQSTFNDTVLISCMTAAKAEM